LEIGDFTYVKDTRREIITSVVALETSTNLLNFNDEKMIKSLDQENTA
jgi:hypothetical protein